MNYIYKRLRPCYEGICVGWFYDCRKAPEEIGTAKNDHEGTMQEHMNGQGDITYGRQILIVLH